MKMISLFTYITIATFMLSFNSIEMETWKSDAPHTNLNFTVSHFLVSDVYGYFRNVDAKFISLKEDFTDAIFEFNAETTSIDTNDEKRDTHLKSPDFFDVENFKTITFKSTTIKKVDLTSYKIIGELTMHGVTQLIELDASITKGTNTRIKREFVSVKINGTISRTQFGIGSNFPDAIIGNDVIIKGSSEFVNE